MSSTNKTSNLGLNQWVASDCPKMEDFNGDNALLDSIISNHTGDITAHVTANQKSNWDNPYYIQIYYGNGSSSRTVALESSFTPVWGIVFPSSTVPGVTDFDNKTHYNYLGFFSSKGCSSGLSISGKNLKVVQSTTAVSGYELRSYNETGVSYICVMFR